MARSKSDISNSAIRIFLQKVGEYYDKSRGLDKFVPNKSQKLKMLKYFNYQCCYCGVKIDESSISQDHLIPMNKENLGLHAWGNVVPCCKDCNNEKQQKLWESFLKSKTNPDVYMYKARKSKIENYVKDMNYDPSLDLTKTAGNLYEDVGEVTMTLINLRYKQAEELIQKLIK